MKSGVWILVIGILIVGIITNISAQQCSQSFTGCKTVEKNVVCEPKCGDGTINQDWEECDEDSNKVSQTCLEKTDGEKNTCRECECFYYLCIKDKACDDGDKCNGKEKCIQDIIHANPEDSENYIDYKNTEVDERGCVAGTPLEADWSDWEIDKSYEDENGCSCTPKTYPTNTILSSINFFSKFSYSFDKFKNIFTVKTTGNSVSVNKEINSENLVENKITGFLTLGDGEHSRIYNNLNEEVQGNLRAVLKGKRADGAWIELKTIIYGDEIKIPANGYLDIGTGIDSNGNKILEGWNERNVLAPEIADDEFGNLYSENIGNLFSEAPGGPRENKEFGVEMDVMINEPPRNFNDEIPSRPIDHCEKIDAVHDVEGKPETYGQQCWFKRTDKNNCEDEKKEAFDCNCQKITKHCSTTNNRQIVISYQNSPIPKIVDCAECEICEEKIDGKPGCVSIGAVKKICGIYSKDGNNVFAGSNLNLFLQSPSPTQNCKVTFTDDDGNTRTVDAPTGIPVNDRVQPLNPTLTEDCNGCKKNFCIPIPVTAPEPIPEKKVSVGCTEETTTGYFDGTKEEIINKFFGNDPKLRDALINLENTINNQAFYVSDENMDLLANFKGTILKYDPELTREFVCPLGLTFKKKVEIESRILFRNDKFYVFLKAYSDGYPTLGECKGREFLGWYLHGVFSKSDYDVDTALQVPFVELNAAQKQVAYYEFLLHFIPYGKSADLFSQGDWFGGTKYFLFDTALFGMGGLMRNGKAIMGTKVIAPSCGVAFAGFATYETGSHTLNQFLDTKYFDGKKLNGEDAFNVIGIATIGIVNGETIYRVTFKQVRGIDCRVASCIAKKELELCSSQCIIGGKSGSKVLVTYQKEGKEVTELMDIDRFWAMHDCNPNLKILNGAGKPIRIGTIHKIIKKEVETIQFTITGPSGKITTKVTSDHLVQLSDGSFVKAGNLKLGDKVKGLWGDGTITEIYPPTLEREIYVYDFETGESYLLEEYGPILKSPSTEGVVEIKGGLRPPEDFINPEVRNTMRSCGGFDRNLLRLKLPNIIIRGVKHRIMSITKTNEYIVLGGKRVYLYEVEAEGLEKPIKITFDESVMGTTTTKVPIYKDGGTETIDLPNHVDIQITADPGTKTSNLGNGYDHEQATIDWEDFFSPL